MSKGTRKKQLPTQRATRGSRSNVLVPENDSSDMEDFFDQAESFASDENGDDEEPRRTPRTASNAAPKDAAALRIPNSRVRLSLPGQGGDNVMTARKLRRPGADNLVPSPSELSKVSTLPPTPATELPADNVEVTLHSEALVEEQEQSTDEEPGGFGAPDDIDDGDDLAPPVMDDDAFLEEPPVAETWGDDHDRKPAARSSVSGSYSEDGDKEGPGFTMTEHAEDEDVFAERRKANKKKRVSIKSDDNSPVPKNKGKKNQRGPIFSPRGIPIGNREYHRIPIVEPSPDDAGDLRRSKRSKQKPLQFWRNERVEYGPAEDDDFVEEIGDMPLPKAIMRAQDTPYRKRKVTGKSTATQSRHKNGHQRASFTTINANDDDNIFDYSKLKKKYKGNLLEGETANVWDDGVDELSDLKVVAYAENMEAADLPLSATRTREDGSVVGKAAQAFNIPSDPNDNYVGYIMGNLYLPPRGIKDAESVGPCSQTFTVCTGQKKAIEVAFADPDGPEGLLDDNSAQRFMLGPGDLFRVPPGNTYRLQNHSKTMPCVLTWTIIRPRMLQPVAQESTPYST